MSRLFGACVFLVAWATTNAQNATDSPAPVYTTQAPTMVSPLNATDSPAPVYTTQAPTMVSPLNATDSPAPVYTTQAPTMVSPLNATDSPVSVTTLAPNTAATTNSLANVTTLSPTTAPDNQNVVHVEVIFKIINKPFSTALLNNTSTQFENMEVSVASELSKVIRTQIKAVRVVQFRAGSVQVRAAFDVVVLSKDSVLSANKSLKTNIEAGSLGSLQVDKNTYAFIITDGNCSTPVVKITNLGASPSEPTKIERSAVYIVQTVIDLNCKSSSNASFEWTIWTLTKSVSDYIASSPAVHKVSGSAELTIKKRSLPYGTYLVAFRVTLLNVSAVFNSDVKYLSVEPSPLIAGISGGSRVNQGFNKIMRLDATPSGDPDVEPGDYSGMTFIWLCKQKGESFPTGSLEKIPVVSYNAGPSGSGGCFGTGVGKLGETNRIVSMNTGKMLVGHSYVVKLFVSKAPGRASSFEQMVDVVNGDPPQMSISCRINCGVKQNPSSRLKVTTQCVSPLNTCKLQLRYHWSVQEWHPATSSWELIPNFQAKFSTRLDSPDAVVKKDVLESDRKYQLTVEVQFPDITPGISSYVFTTNGRPHSGTCSVLPLTGVALETDFAFECVNWQDPDQPLSYHFDYVTEPGLTSVISHGSSNTATSKLPSGKAEDGYTLTINVRIIDSLSAFTMDEVKVTVRPIDSSGETKKVLEKGTKDVDLLLKSGDVKAATQLANAVLQTMSDAPSSEVTTAEKTQLVDDIVQQMTSQVKPENLQALTQLTSVIGRATANPDDVSLGAQENSIKVLESMTTLLGEKSEDNSATEDALVEAGGENLALSLGNIMNSASKKAKITGNKGVDAAKKSRESIKVAEKSVNLVNKVGLSLLKRKVVGENPSVIKTASLSLVLGRQRPHEFSKARIEDGDTSFIMPSKDNFGSSLGKLKFIDSQMTSTDFNPFTWDATSTTVTSKVTSLVLRDDEGVEISVKDLKHDIQISIPQSTSPTHRIEEQKSFLKPEKIRNYKFVINQPGTAIELNITAASQATLVKIFVSFKKKPSISSHNYGSLVKDLPLCTTSALPEACTKQHNLVFLSSGLFPVKGVYYVGIMLDTLQSRSRRRRSCFGHRRSKRSCVEPKDPPKPQNLTIIPVYDPKTDVNYTLSIQRYNCVFWDNEKWTSNGCKVGSQSTKGSLQCLCNHLTSFGGGLFIEPNPIDFDVVLKELLKLDNVAVLSTILVFFFLYLVVAIIARRADRKDIKKFGPPIMMSTSEHGGFQYELTIITGVWKNCGTTAKVAIEIHGSEASSDQIILSSDMRPPRLVLVSGNADMFVISLPVSLGTIEYLNVFHDNSGESPSWFLDQIVIKDMQMGNVWFFIHNDWLALEKGDGKINKILIPTSPVEMKSFKYSFNYRTTKKFTEDHLWLSVLTKPPYSNFTRLQRATCCLCVLFAVMIANAMFYQVKTTPEPKIQVGPLQFSWRQIQVGISSSIIVVPIGILVVFLFKNSRAGKVKTKNQSNGIKKWTAKCFCCREGKTTESHQKRSSSKECLASNDELRNTPGDSPTSSTDGSSSETKSKKSVATSHFIVIENVTDILEKSKGNSIPVEHRVDMDEILCKREEDDKAKEVNFNASANISPNAKRKQSETSTTYDLAILIALGDSCSTTEIDNKNVDKNKTDLKNSKECKTNKKFRDVFNDIFFTKDSSPDSRVAFSLPHGCVYVSWVVCIVTVLVSASFTFSYSLQWGKEISNEWLSSMLVSFIEDLFVIQPIKIILVAIIMAYFLRKVPTKEKTLAVAPGNHSVQEKNTFDNVEEKVKLNIITDDQLEKAKEYQIKEEKMFSFVRELIIYGIFLVLLTIVCYGNRSYYGYALTKTVKDESSNFTKISTSKKYWKWTDSQFNANAYAGNWYNGVPEPNEVYIGNKRSILIGMPRIRQLRIKPDTCIVPKKARTTTKHCYDEYSFDEEDKTPLYLPGWKPFANSNADWANASQLCPKPWRYNTAEELGFFPSWGAHHMYSGGGYVADLGYRTTTASFVTLPLQKYRWIDQRTRALLLEFAVFNPSTNQLSAVTFYYEVLPSMFGHPFRTVETFALYGSQSGPYDFVLVCKLLFIFFVVFYLAREAKRAYQMRRIYLRNLWNWFEVMQVFVALAVVICYIIKEKSISDAIQHVKANPFVTTNFQTTLVWKNAEDVALSLAIFIATVKILRMLRFNPHIIIFSASLKASRSTLVAYSLILFVVITSFTLLGYLTLGSSMSHYKTFLQALYTQIQLSLGAKMRLTEIRNVSPYIGVGFGFIYKVLMAFIFVNFYVAVINDSYADVKSSTDTNSKQFEMADFILDRLREILLRNTRQKYDRVTSSYSNEGASFQDERNTSQGESTPDATEESSENEPSKANDFILEDSHGSVEVIRIESEKYESTAISTHLDTDLQSSQTTRTTNTKLAENGARSQSSTQNMKTTRRKLRKERKKSVTFKNKTILVDVHKPRPETGRPDTGRPNTSRSDTDRPDTDRPQEAEPLRLKGDLDLEEKAFQIYQRTNVLRKEDQDEDVDFLNILILLLEKYTRRKEGSPSPANSLADFEEDICETYECDEEILQEDLWGSSQDLLNELVSTRNRRVPVHLRVNNFIESLEKKRNANQAAKLRRKSQWIP